MVLCSQEHGALILFFLLIGWISIINILCLLNYPLMLAQIEAICIHKEPFIYFLLSSLFSIVIFLFVTFFNFLLFFSSLLSCFPWMSRQVREERGRTRAGCTAVKSINIGFSEVYVCIYFPPLVCVHFSTPPFSARIMVTVKWALRMAVKTEWCNMHKASDIVPDTGRAQSHICSC